MLHEPNVAIAASMLADPARVMMLSALLDGRALPAVELAHASGITAQTASSHLSKLLAAGMVSVETQGRHRYYRLAGAHVAQAIEFLATIQPVGPVRRRVVSEQEREMKFARCCYDHLAGQAGVAVTQALEEHKYLISAPDKRFDVTPVGEAWFNSIGLDISAVKPTRRGLAWKCLDWTERTHHLAGPLGEEFLKLLGRAGWMSRSKVGRVVEISLKGRTELRRHLGVNL